jgi:hypothetical protein
VILDLLDSKPTTKQITEQEQKPPFFVCVKSEGFAKWLALAYLACNLEQKLPFCIKPLTL